MRNWFWRFFDYPQFPGAKRGGTSREAAEHANLNAPTLRAAVLKLLRNEPLTADECAAHLNEGVLSIRPRLSELVRMDLIEDSGLTRLNASGRNATVWLAVKGSAASGITKIAS